MIDVCIPDSCFVKQKTAYEMLISDWSSDVCSSDLLLEAGSSLILRPRPRIARGNHYQSSTVNSDTVMKASGSPASPWLHESRSTVASPTIWPATTNSASGRHSARRSEERRLGKGCGRKCRSRGSADQ